MSNLNDRKGCLVQLAVLGGHDIVIVEQVRSRGQPAYQIASATECRAQTTASDVAYWLTYSPRRTSPRPNTAGSSPASGGAKSPSAKGWGQERTSPSPSPLPSPSTLRTARQFAALSVIGQPSQQDPSAVVEAVRTTARELTAAGSQFRRHAGQLIYAGPLA